MIEKLPNWLLPNMKPAFNDLESATAIEMVYKLYGKNQELIDDYNKFLKDIRNEVNAFKTSTNQDMECFKNNITKICNDYIATMDMKIDCQDRKIADAIQYMKDNLVNTIKELNDNNELDNMIVEAISNVENELLQKQTNYENRVNTELQTQKARINNLTNLQEGSTTGDAELTDIRVGYDGSEYETAGESVRGQATKLYNTTKNNHNMYNDILNKMFDYIGKYNILEDCTIKENVGLSSNTGKEIENAEGYFCTDFIPILPNKLITMSYVYTIVEYDISKKVITGYTCQTADGYYKQLTTNPETAYIKCAKNPNYVKQSDIFAITYGQEEIRTKIEKMGNKYSMNQEFVEKLAKEINLSPIQKRISILGDSYSTYGGFVTPSTNRCFYNGESEDEDTSDVSDIWWYKLIQDMNYTLEYNNSYSGSPVCNTGYSGGDASNFSFLKRMQDIGRPDVLFIFGGTNDSWANVPIGKFKYTDFTTDDLKTFRPAFANMLEYLTKHHPNTQIYNITNFGLSEDITNSIDTICQHYNIQNIVLTEFDRPYGQHPGVSGQTSIFNQVKSAII